MKVDECVALAKKYNKTLQGNMDPGVLYGSDESIKMEVGRQMQQFKDIPYIGNLGQGIWPDIQPSKVAVYV